MSQNFSESNTAKSVYKEIKKNYQRIKNMQYEMDEEQGETLYEMSMKRYKRRESEEKELDTNYSDETQIQFSRFAKLDEMETKPSSRCGIAQFYEALQTEYHTEKEQTMDVGSPKNKDEETPRKTILEKLANDSPAILSATVTVNVDDGTRSNERKTTPEVFSEMCREKSIKNAMLPDIQKKDIKFTGCKKFCNGQNKGQKPSSGTMPKVPQDTKMKLKKDDSTTGMSDRAKKELVAKFEEKLRKQHLEEIEKKVGAYRYYRQMAVTRNEVSHNK